MDLKRLINRFYPTGFLFLCGLIVIIYGAIGFLYVQQGIKQKDFNEQIIKLSAVVEKGLPKSGELQREYEAVLQALTPMSDTEAIARLVDMAGKNGIDVSEGAAKFLVPSAKIHEKQVEGSTYRIISFTNIIVQGDHDNVIAFLTDLDSGTTLPNMVLTKMVISKVETPYTGEEETRRLEFLAVADAVKEMIADNAIETILAPISYLDGLATNYMGDAPETEEIFEGFPDNTTPAEIKGYTGNLTPRNGFVLYQHDKILLSDPSQYVTVDYINTPTTRYYYTCEPNGFVRQFNGPNVTTATEFFDTELIKSELKIIFDVDIYTKS